MAGSFTSRKRLLVANSGGWGVGAQKTIDWSPSGPLLPPCGWVSGIELGMPDLQGKHLYTLRHLTGP